MVRRIEAGTIDRDNSTKGETAQPGGIVTATRHSDIGQGKGPFKCYITLFSGTWTRHVLITLIRFDYTPT